MYIFSTLALLVCPKNVTVGPKILLAYEIRGILGRRLAIVEPESAEQPHRVQMLALLKYLYIYIYTNIHS